MLCSSLVLQRKPRKILGSRQCTNDNLTMASTGTANTTGNATSSATNNNSSLIIGPTQPTAANTASSSSALMNRGGGGSSSQQQHPNNNPGFITPDRWLMPGPSPATVTAPAAGNNNNNNTGGGMFCWPSTPPPPPNYAQFLQHAPNMVAAAVSASNSNNRLHHHQMQMPAAQQSVQQGGANAFYGPMMGQPYFDENSLRYPSNNNNNNNGSNSNPSASSMACHDANGAAGATTSATAAGNKSGNATVQIEIQCINHTNPININSPSGMNNVASMSCGNMHHHHGQQAPPPQQQQQHQQYQQQQHMLHLQQQQQQQHYQPYGLGSVDGLPKHQPPSYIGNTTNTNHTDNSLSMGAAFYRSRYQPLSAQPPPKHHEFYCTNASTAAAAAAAASAAAAANADPYDTADVPFMLPSTVDCHSVGGSSGSISISTTAGCAKLEQFTEITQMAMRGCELAERLAHTHRNRPCFKKIDSLCARMKQDLVRPDSVLANINSQGMAWAVKDFIFVFTRIINAWIIIKGYVYNTPEGLAKVKNALSPEFGESFARWQDSTMEFVDNLIKSFMNLDQLVQSQRNAFQKYESPGNGGNAAGKMSGGVGGMAGTRKREATNGGSGFGAAAAAMMMNAGDEHLMLMDETITECMFRMFSLEGGNSRAYEGCHSSDQRNKCSSASSVAAACSSADGGSMHLMVPDNSPNKSGSEQSISYMSNVIEDSEETQRQALEKGTYFKTGLYNPLKKELHAGNEFSAVAGMKLPNEPKSIFTQPMSLGGSTNVPSASCATSSPRMMNRLQDLGCLELGSTVVSAATKGDAERRQFVYEQPQQLQQPAKACDASVDAKLEYLLAKICSLNEAKYFFATQFTKNYFPDFQSSVPNYIDLRTIMLKSQTGGYGNVYELVHDLRQIVYSAHSFLRLHPHIFLSSTIVAFDNELDSILRDAFFSEYDFGHIEGMPGESLQPPKAAMPISPPPAAANSGATMSFFRN